VRRDRQGVCGERSHGRLGSQAKAEGRYRGRDPSARKQSEQIMALVAQGLSRPKIAAELGISERSVYRVLSAKLGRTVTARQPQ
jgi:DNA invertase Pin-like site-specific DNA recombinase